MRRATALVLGLVCLFLATVPAAAQPALDTEDKKTLYALGLALAQRLKTFDLTDAEVELIKDGLADGILGRDEKVELMTYGPKIDAMMRARGEAVAAREKEAGQKFVDEEAQKPGAVTTESGVVYIEVEPGTGPMPQVTDTVSLHYHGTLRDGTMFDSSIKAGEPAKFALNSVIPCFSQGLTKMKVGGKSRLVCPADTAYGDRGQPPSIPGGATLVFDVELLDIVTGGATPSGG